MISAKTSGSFKKSEAFLKRVSTLDIGAILRSKGQAGVAALAKATPVDSGLAAGSWGFVVVKNLSGYSITWTNSDIETGFPVSLMLQYGYSTGTGGYVPGRNYINPAMSPVFTMLSDTVWKAVTSA